MVGEHQIWVVSRCEFSAHRYIDAVPKNQMLQDILIFSYLFYTQSESNWWTLIRISMKINLSELVKHGVFIRPTWVS